MMNLGAISELHAGIDDTPGGNKIVYKGVTIIGFSPAEEKLVKTVIDCIPTKNLKSVKTLLADSGLKPKHGRYFPSVRLALLNPGVLHDKKVFGTNPPSDHGHLTLTHEFGHGVYSQLSEAARKEWLKISGWVMAKDKTSDHDFPYKEKRSGWPRLTSDKVHLKDAKFVRTYSEKNDDEDFADHFAYYVLGHAADMSKEKLAFMKKYVGEVPHAAGTND